MIDQNKELTAQQKASKAYYQKNKEKIKARSKEHRLKNKDEVAAYMKFYRESNLEKLREQDREYRSKPEVKERITSYAKEYGKANAEKIKEKNKKYREENADKVKMRDRVYRENNSEKIALYRKLNRHIMNTHRAKRRAATLKATPAWADLEAIKCVYQEAQYFGYHVDHVIPLQGKNVCGLHVVENLQILSPSINLSKSNKFDESLLT